jgi:hypothetical protein
MTGRDVSESTTLLRLMRCWVLRLLDNYVTRPESVSLCCQSSANFDQGAADNKAATDQSFEDLGARVDSTGVSNDPFAVLSLQERSSDLTRPDDEVRHNPSSF